MHEYSKRTHFHISLKYIYFFYIFAHTFLNHVLYMTWGTRYKLNKYSNLVQLWYVIISMISFIFFYYTKNSTHYKIMVPGLQGPAGGPCKSEDITGWGLNGSSIPMETSCGYMGHIIANDLIENDIRRQSGCFYGRINMLLRTFGTCSYAVKLLLFMKKWRRIEFTRYI